MGYFIPGHIVPKAGSSAHRINVGLAVLARIGKEAIITIHCLNKGNIIVKMQSRYPIQLCQTSNVTAYCCDESFYESIHKKAAKINKKFADNMQTCICRR